MVFSTRKLLIIGSLVVHGAIAFALFVSGIWKLERLDPERRTIGLAVMEPPAASGSPLAAQVAPKMVPKAPRIAPVITQPVVRIEKVAATASSALTTGNGLGSGAGSGDNPDGDDKDTGSCVGPTCGGTIPQPPAIKIPPLTCKEDSTLCPPVPVIPTVLKALRVSGETNLVPSDVVKTQMMRDGHTRSMGVFQVCIGTTGAITSVSVSASTRYPAYDASIAAAVRSWRYRPYLVSGRPTAACGIVTFLYTIK